VEQPLVCPACGTGGGLSERFCPRCGSPFVYAPGMAGRSSPREDEARARARKVHPPYAEGELVRVATAQNQPEAELIQGLLLEEGVPSLVRRSGGFDVPDFLAAGPRDILVPRGGEEAARAVLQPRPGMTRSRRPARRGVRALALALAVLVLALVATGVIVAIIG
jgi:Putative prokaryotic signal transducing protein